MNRRSDSALKRGSFSTLALLSVLLPSLLRAQTADRPICNKIFSSAYEHLLTEKSTGDIITAVGEQFLGSPYAEHTLDSSAEEHLIVNLHSFDCVTYVENVLALAECIKRDRFSYDEYTKTLESLRYRDGKRNGYASRLHYFSEWISNNIEKGYIEDRTKDLHGVVQKTTINYLYRHAQNNPHLQEDSVKEEIRAVEQKLSGMERYVIPVANLKSIEPEIDNGDLIAIATSQEGLDIGHTGFAVRGSDGVLHLLHASETDKKVEITTESLRQYLQKHPKDIGIMVLKPRVVR